MVEFIAVLYLLLCFYLENLINNKPALVVLQLLGHKHIIIAQ